MKTIKKLVWTKTTVKTLVWAVVTFLLFGGIGWLETGMFAHSMIAALIASVIKTPVYAIYEKAFPKAWDALTAPKVSQVAVVIEG